MAANKEINKAYDDVYAAKDWLHNTMKNLFPAGKRVTWLHRAKHRQFGIVQRHNSYDQALVKNENTDKEVWLGAYRLEVA